MPLAYLLTGANLGERKKQLELATALIFERAGAKVALSAYYESTAWGKTDQPAFLNQAICIHTSLPPETLLHQLLLIEQQLGRVRGEKYGPRLIDIDILLYDQLHLQQQELVIPHPELPNRRFALVPLAEIAVDYCHPVLHCTVGTLLAHCTDQGEVFKIS